MDGLDEWRGRRGLLRHVDVALFVFHAMGEVLANSLGNLAQVNKAIGHVDQLGSGVGTKAARASVTFSVAGGTILNIYSQILTRSQRSIAWPITVSGA